MALTQNHFELFGLPVAFDVDVHQLAERYRQLQRASHPDRYANASDRERRLSIQHAAQVNDAFQTSNLPCVAPAICCSSRVLTSMMKRRPISIQLS